jgi:hypothetical protein
MIVRAAFVAAIPYLSGSCVAFVMLPEQQLVHRSLLGRVAQALLPQWLWTYRGAKLAGGSQAAALAFIAFIWMTGQFREALPAWVLPYSGPGIVLGAFLVGWLVYELIQQPRESR